MVPFKIDLLSEAFDIEYYDHFSLSQGQIIGCSIKTLKQSKQVCSGLETYSCGLPDVIFFIFGGLVVLFSNIPIGYSEKSFSWQEE